MHDVLFVDRFETPVGSFVLSADAQGRLRSLSWSIEPAQAHEVKRNPFGITEVVQAYFAGDVHAIDAIEVDGQGTAFQRQVWAALRQIPCGQTISYGELARRIGNPSAMRAVGMANNANPIAIVVPCHRVIGADGTLTGYAGGLERKRWLLTHERAMPNLSLDLRLAR